MHQQRVLAKERSSCASLGKQTLVYFQHFVERANRWRSRKQRTVPLLKKGANKHLTFPQGNKSSERSFPQPGRNE